MAFVHLHNHTQYSLLDGACRADKMLMMAKELGMPAVAMTDHGNMFGAIDFFHAAKRIGVKPIIGLEAYVISGEFDAPESKKEIRHHLVLLAKNLKGYKNLMKLTSDSYIKGFYYKPRITKSMLQEHSEGLICLSACLKGEIPTLLYNGREKKAIDAVNWYKEVFPGRYYIELQDHGIEEEKVIFPLLVDLAKKTDTPLVVTNDCHYLKKEDSEAHDVLLCIQTGKSLSDPDRLKYNTSQLYFKSEEKMKELFPDFPEAYENTVKIADEIDLELDYNNFLLPDFEIPEQYKDKNEYLKAMCYDNAKTKYSDFNDEVKARIDYELSVINKMGFEGYFLVVKDIVDASREMNVPVGPGRGSAAGSIVSYLLGITQIEPLKYGLFFERFLNPERIGMPDIDIDFCAEGRSKVIDYIVERYGRASVTQIVTFSLLGAKSVIKDVARVMDVPAAEANEITKLIPSEPKITLEKALRKSGEFRDRMNSDDRNLSILEYSKVLEGLVRHIGIHAAGVVIAPGSLSDYVPLAVTNQKGSDPVVVVQYEGKWLDELKMLKMDILGLKTLSVIKKTIRMIKESREIDVDIDNVDLTDKKTFRLLSHGWTDGVFQFESAGMKKYLSELKPNKFEDLIAMVSLYRPGPMQFIDTFIKRKHGEQEVRFAHPLTENTLKETYGVTVYQEQVMQIAREMGGMSGAEADTLRKAISKKKLKMMEKLKAKFVEGSEKNGVKLQVIEQIWEEWVDFANYAFNKSHATAYAFIAFQTAYLKTHFHVEFMAALLSLEDKPDKIPYFMDECKSMGIEVEAPNINKSRKDFVVTGKKIKFGLKAIKNCGTAAINSIISEREAKGEFKNIFEFSSRVDPMAVNKGVLESLICSGAMDDFEGNRAQKFEAIETALEYASGVHKEKKRGQMMLFDSFVEEDEDEFLPTLPNMHEWALNHKLKEEKKFLGFYWSGHPLNRHKQTLDMFINVTAQTAEFEPEKVPGNIAVAGVVSEVIKKTGKRNNPFCIVILEDITGKFEMALFGEDYDNYANMMEEGKELFILGKKNTFGNGNENILRVKPSRIFPLSEVAKVLSGEVYIKLDEKSVTPDFTSEMKKFIDRKVGRFGLHITLETEKFKTLNIHPKNARIFPGDDFFELFKGKFIQEPKVRLNFS